MKYAPLYDCLKSSIGHDMEIIIRDVNDIRIHDDGESIVVRVKCRNCGVIAWERFESVEWVREEE